MKLFKEIHNATQEDIKCHDDIDIIIRLANTVIIDTEDRLLVVKHDLSNTNIDVSDIKFYNAMCNKDFVNIESSKKQSAEQILSLYNKNVRIISDKETIQGLKIFQSRILNQK